jgi:hypothetical protein
VPVNAQRQLTLSRGRSYAKASPSRFTFLIAVIPFGDSTFSSAVDEALAQRGGDALLNVTVSSSLYGFVPIYNVYSFTCTSVQGVAVKFKPIAVPTASDGRGDLVPVAQKGQ